MGSISGDEHMVSVSKGDLVQHPNGLTDMQTFNEFGSISYNNGSAEWQFLPSAYNVYDFGMQDDLPATQPFHGDFVASQFAFSWTPM